MLIGIAGPSHAVQLKKNIDQGKVTGADQFSVVGYQSAPVFTEMILDAVTEMSSSCSISCTLEW